MILSLMRFCGYEWEHNPVRLEVLHQRVKNTRLLPFFGTKVTDMGRLTRVVRGEGELLGEGCIHEFRRLEKLFEEDKKGLLTLPGLHPFYACFTEFSAVGEVTPDLITYRFEFTECDNLPSDDEASVYVCKAGETLFDIAYDTGVKVSRLVAINPQIKRPDEMSEGMEVRLC